MPRATCRCGQKLSFPADGPDRVVCPKCSARIRVRRRDPAAEAAAEAEAAMQEGDGFLRFSCPCGRRLKVRDTRPRPESGRCPDCGRVVPVPALAVATGVGAGSRGASADPESPTVDMDPADLADLARWAETYRKGSRTRATTGGTPPADDEPAAVNFGDQGDQAPVTETYHPPAPAPVKIEAGLRVCPRCGRPIHLGAETCRQCGAHVPRR